MKSSTTFRSMLSKESMDVRENLAIEQPSEIDELSYNADEDISSAPNEYVRTGEKEDNKSQEIDLLWQTFKSAQFNSNSPASYVICGFIFGVILTASVFLILGAMGLDRKGNMFGMFSPKSDIEAVTDISVDETVSASVVAENNEVTEEASENQNEEPVEKASTTQQPQAIDIKNTKKYVVKDGDTVEAIIKHNYGAYTPERADKILKANNLKNLDHISIGQVLLIPIEK